MKTYRKNILVCSIALLFGGLLATHSIANTLTLPGLTAPATMYENADGIPTVVGANELDVAFVQGYHAASARFFQMDFNRRAAGGTLAEIMGGAALASDIQLRTLGLGRAAVATFKQQNAQVKGVLQAYANGVNAWLENNNLPPEYSVLEIDKAQRWTPVDSILITKVLAFQLGFRLDTDETILLGAYQQAGEIGGFNGLALYAEDLMRKDNPDKTTTIDGFLGSIGGVGGATAAAGNKNISKKVARKQRKFALKTIFSNNFRLSQQVIDLAADLKAKTIGVPLLDTDMRDVKGENGTNWWVISGDKTASGHAMLMNDPHLSLGAPSIFYEVSLVYKDTDWSASGVAFAGIPGVVQGCNSYLCWGSSVNPLDQTDTFFEEFQLNKFGLPTHTMYKGEAEPLKVIFQSYYVNQVGDGEMSNTERAEVGYDAGGITFVVPRRNNGPIVNTDGSGGLSVQYAGWGATFELQAFLEMNHARSMDDFKAALQHFDIGSQNFGYADIDGNIAYFSGAEMPIRSDLQKGIVDGAPPWIIRDGTGAADNEWMPVTNPQPHQALPFEILPFAEMPQVINPPSGYIANANNDPIGVTIDNNPLNQLRPGGGIYYLNDKYSDFRLGRIDRELRALLDNTIPIDGANMVELQSNHQLLDAEIVIGLIEPYLLAAGLPAQHPLGEAINRLLAWDYSSPTGIQEGYDPGDDPNNLPLPTQQEIDNSVAATIYAMFRSQFLKNSIDGTLDFIGLGDFKPSSGQQWNNLIHLLKVFPEQGGVGISGIPFINAPDANSPAEALTMILLKSLQDSLDRLASDEFAPAFANSTNQDDYRWGKLHRIVFRHAFGSDPFNIPNGGGFSQLGPDLPGVARSGGYGAVDASHHSPRAENLNDFMFFNGPARRFWGIMDPMGIDGHEILPGGNNGIFLHPWYSNQLGRWLTNQYHQLPLGEDDGVNNAVIVTDFQPPSP
ncbi:MAG: penicillin acylase family protein [Xanthomonadales bacterium]|nr:penicillin acylase family protein [Xanthomonadales bacterium]